MTLPHPDPRTRWQLLCLTIGAKDNPHTGRTIDGTYDELVAAYSGPNRHYHDLNHILEGIDMLDEVGTLAEDPEVLEMAWKWHDETYKTDPSKSKDNELVSAANAFKALRELSVPDRFCVDVMATIMPTLHTYIPKKFDHKLIVDIDLWRLSAIPEKFDEYSEMIRLEYGAPVDAYQIARAEFFHKFLQNRPSIYLTDYFKERYEAPAQANLKRAMVILAK